jgi:hypothetical protein
LAYVKIREFDENDGIMSYTGNPDGAAYVYAEVWEQVNIAANTSDVMIKIYEKNTDAYISYDSNIPYTMHIAGSYYSGNILNFEEAAQPGTVLMLSKTKTGIAHNADGSKTISIDFFLDTGTSAIGDITLPATNVALTTIPRAATIQTFPDFNIGDHILSTVTNPGNFSMTAVLKVGSITILTRTGLTGTSINITPTETEINALYSNCPNSNSLDVTLYITTYNGGVQVGDTDDMSGTAHVTDSNPLFTAFSFADINAVTLALTGDSSVIVLGKSNIKASVSVANKAVAQNYASILSYLTTILLKQSSAAYDDADSVEMTINNVNSATVYVTAIDSRNNQTTPDPLIGTLLNYSTPVIASANIVRDNDIDATTRLSFSGSIWYGNFGLSSNSLVSAKYKYKETNSSVWSSDIDISSYITNTNGAISMPSTAIQGDLGGSGFDTDKSFDIRITIVDGNGENELSTYLYDLILDTGTPGIFGRKNEDGTYDFGFGKIPDVGKAIDAIGAIYANDGDQVLTEKYLQIFSGMVSAVDVNTALSSAITNVGYSKVMIRFRTRINSWTNSHIFIPIWKINYGEGSTTFISHVMNTYLNDVLEMMHFCFTDSTHFKIKFNTAPDGNDAFGITGIYLLS